MSDISQFEAVLREQGPRIYTLAVRLTGNLTEGQDLAQEAFLQAYKNWDQFRNEASASTWLYRICVNVWKNRVRYEKRRSFWRHFSFSTREGEALDLPMREPPSGHELEALDEMSQLQVALQKLEAEERGILMMREVEGRSYEEISGLLNVPVGTVRSRLSRARERLRAVFQKHPEVKP